MAAGADHQDRAARRARAGARWLIDGMNLIGSRPDRWWNDPDRAVRRLIHELDRYAAATGEDVTVVFDRQPPDVQPGRHGAAVVAFASRAGRNTADDEIVRVLAADPAPPSVRVVTSDKRLAERARLLGARVRSSGGFRRGWMRRRARPPMAPEPVSHASDDRRSPAAVAGVGAGLRCGGHSRCPSAAAHPIRLGDTRWTPRLT
jgi:predicted RNA-binding protein with PIN domain